MANQDDRGFQKAELVMFNPQAPNLQSGVNLVERDTCPNGYQLVDPDRSGKKTQHDLVELAQQVEKADQFTRATAGSKLQIIAEQVNTQIIQHLNCLELQNNFIYTVYTIFFFRSDFYKIKLEKC